MSDKTELALIVINNRLKDLLSLKYAHNLELRKDLLDVKRKIRSVETTTGNTIFYCMLILMYMVIKDSNVSLEAFKDVMFKVELFIGMMVHYAIQASYILVIVVPVIAVCVFMYKKLRSKQSKE